MNQAGRLIDRCLNAAGGQDGRGPWHGVQLSAADQRFFISFWAPTDSPRREESDGVDGSRIAPAEGMIPSCWTRHRRTFPGRVGGAARQSLGSGERRLRGYADKRQDPSRARRPGPVRWWLADVPGPSTRESGPTRRTASVTMQQRPDLDYSCPRSTGTCQGLTRRPPNWGVLGIRSFPRPAWRRCGTPNRGQERRPWCRA